MRMMRDLICRECGHKQEDYIKVEEILELTCSNCGQKTLKLDPKLSCNFIDKNKVNNWGKGKSAMQQASALAGNSDPY